MIGQSCRGLFAMHDADALIVDDGDDIKILNGLKVENFPRIHNPRGSSADTLI